MEPLTGTKPLALDRLTELEIDLLMKINERLIGMMDQNEELRAPYSWRSDHPWAQLDAHRSNRIVVIDGGRGVGKTTLLLTLINEWQDHRRQIERATRESANTLQNALNDAGSYIRAFQPLDFDPLPHSMPLHGWLLQPWSAVVNGISQTFAAHGASDDVLDIAQDPRERFRRLFERAVTGWSTPQPNGRSQLEHSLDLFDQTNNWLSLVGDWHNFVNETLQALEGEATPATLKIAPKRSLIVLPIDDIDLQCEKLPELFHALRLFYHPRVVYLLTADVEHARRILEADYRKRHRIAEGAIVDSGDELRDDTADVRSTMYADAKELAGAQMEKAVHQALRFPVEPLSVSSALFVFVKGSNFLKDVLNRLCTVRAYARHAIGADETKQVTLGEMTLGEALNEVSAQAPIEGVSTFRRLQQAIESDANLLTTLATGQVTVSDNADGKPTILSSGQLEIRGKASLVSVPAFGGTIATGSQFNLVLGSLATDFREPENLYLAILLRDLECIDAPNINSLIGEGFAWTQWENGGDEFLYVWPFAEYPTLPQFHYARWWWQNVALRDERTSSPQLREQTGLLSCWITLQLAWKLGQCPGRRIYGLEEFAGEVADRAYDGVREELLKWVSDDLYLMSFPEYRLQPEARHTLRAACEKVLGESPARSATEARRLRLATEAYIEAKERAQHSSGSMRRRRGGEQTSIDDGAETKAERLISWVNQNDQKPRGTPATKRSAKRRLRVRSQTRS